MFNNKLLIIFLLVFPFNIQAKTLLVLGDSLSAAYGMPVESGWVSLLEQRIIRHELEYKVVNASISGETTLGASTRIDKILNENRPDIVIVELGGNDGLRGFSLAEIEQNLVKIVNTIKNHESRVLLIPIQLPPNYGEAYNRRFRSIYQSVSTDLNVTLSEFILEDIATNPDLMQPDGIHPKQAAQMKMLDNVWPAIQGMMMQ